LAGAKAWGVDVNPWCVEATLENLRWLKKEYGLQGAEYKVLQGDSRSLSTSVQREVDCVATEPDLGPALRHIPTTAYASKIVDRLRPLFRDFLEGAHDVLKTGGRLLLVTPYIKTRSGTPVTMDVEQWALNVGLRRVHPFGRTVFAGNGARESLNKTASFVDAEKRHRIGREIHVFQK